MNESDIEKLKEITGVDLISLHEPDNCIDNNPYILYWAEGSKIIHISLKVKNPTIDWVLKQIQIKSINTYKNITEVFERLGLKKDCSIYYTTFGFSISTFLFTKEFNNKVKTFTDYLTLNKIAFRCEYSDAFWVYRFRISKSQENIDKIKSLN